MSIYINTSILQYCKQEIFFTKFLRNFSSLYKCIRITSIHRLYTGPKEEWGFNVLSSPAYKKVMENNVELDVSFNDWDISTEKTLTEPKSALFDWSDNKDCQVKFDSMSNT